MRKIYKKINSISKVKFEYLLGISSKHSQKSSKQKALMLTRNECLLENLVSTNISRKQTMESCKQIINTYYKIALKTKYKKN